MRCVCAGTSVLLADIRFVHGLPKLSGEIIHAITTDLSLARKFSVDGFQRSFTLCQGLVLFGVSIVADFSGESGVVLKEPFGPDR